MGPHVVSGSGQLKMGLDIEHNHEVILLQVVLMPDLL
jgi:hypothetical protein